MTVYLPVFAWMLVIFTASTDIGSSQRTSRIIGPLLRWFKPDVSDQTIRAVQAVVRKGGHLTEYGILSALLWRARRLRRPQTVWHWPEAGFVVALCAAYAVTDELHQHFVSSRQASPLDVLIDTCGAALALLAIWWIGRLRKAW